MFTKSIAVFVAAVVLVTVSPAMAQSSSDLLASIERVVLTTEVEQDQSVVRRRRSGGLAWTGGGLVVAGIVLALRPPVCELLGSKEEMIVIGEGWVLTSEFEAIVAEDGTCDVVRFSEVDNFTYQDYWSSSSPERLLGRAPITRKTWNYVGWATAAAGGALMWFGLRSVDVPVRFDVAPTGGFRVSRSFGW